MPLPMGRAKGTGTSVPIKPTATGMRRRRVAVTMADGTRVWRTATARTDAEAKRKADRILAQLVEARELDLDPTRLTLEAYLRRWIDGLRSQRNGRANAATVDRYESIVERLMIPELGALKLGAPSLPRRIQAWCDSLDRSPETVRHYHGILQHALDRAVATRLIAWNPASATELPRMARQSVAKPMTVDEARAFLAATADDRLAALWRLAIVTGMRSGELRGLTWAAVGEDWIEVKAQLQRVRQDRGGDARGWALTPTKVARTVERIAIDADTVAALERHRRRMAEERQPDWLYHGLVFVNAHGRPFSRFALLDEFKAACQRAGLAERRVHDLRHTNLRMLKDLGVDESVRMARAGHQTKAMARQYGGASLVQDQLAADAVGKAVGGAS